MKRTGTCLLSTLLLLGSASLATAGAYGEEETAETPAAPSAPAPAAAATDTVVEAKYGEPGGYIEVGGSYVVQVFDEDAGIKGVPLDDTDNTGGYEIRAGYRVNNWLGIEAEWEQFLHFKNVNLRDTGCTVDCGANLDMWSLMMNAKFFPLRGRFQPYGIVGIGVAKAEFETSLPIGKQDEHGFAARFGVGVDVYITEQIGLAFEADYILPTGDAHEFDVIPFSGSIFYRFG
ncbi:MAG TPA: porin family protein [Candidatus Limnocylindrales bacterium]|nr:porin family protein [Candidatus Limnocylindrales bacterium]